MKTRDTHIQQEDNIEALQGTGESRQYTTGYKRARQYKDNT